MAKKLQLQIPEPCHEDWEKMKACDKGRFCNSCQKTVIDFTGMSDAQLVAFFRSPATGSLCGRFNDQQLDREISMPQKRIPWFKYMLRLCLPVFIANTKASSQGVVKETLNTTTEICAEPNVFHDRLRASRHVDAQCLNNRLVGRVINEAGNPVPYSSIFIKDTKQGVNCDAGGYFDIQVNPDDKFVTIVASGIGYKTNEKVISNNSGSMNEIVLRTETTLLKEIVITSYSGTRKGLLIGSYSIKKVRQDSMVNRIKNFFVKDSLRVYPNPARSGGEIKIEKTNSQTGDLLIEIFNLQGQMISSRFVNNYGENKVLTYKLPTAIAGSYLVRVINKKSGKAHTEKIIIQ